MQICKRCLYTENIPGIVFDDAGVCNYCHTHDKMEREYPISKDKFDRLISEMHKKRSGEYDAVIGISGGCDSSYLLWKTVEAGLKPLAVHWDNNWNTITAKENMEKMLDELGVNVETVSVPKEEYDDLCRSFLYASTPDADIPNDIALTKVLYTKAREHNLEYIINGHSFRTEGFCPIDWTYMDGKYIASVQKKFGKETITHFPNLLIKEWLSYLQSGIKRVRPLYYLDYDKENAKNDLNANFKWEWYGAHHAENTYTKFIGGYLWAYKFKQDLRYVQYSALIRSGQMNRALGWKLVHTPQYIEMNILDQVKKRLHLTGEMFEVIMNLPVNSYKNYETYKKYFVHKRKQFKTMYKKGLIPYTFYEKYCKK